MTPLSILWAALYWIDDPLGGVVSQRNKILFYGHVNEVFKIILQQINRQTSHSNSPIAFLHVTLAFITKTAIYNILHTNWPHFPFSPFFITSQLLYSIFNHLPKQNLSILCTIRLYKLRKLGDNTPWLT